MLIVIVWDFCEPDCSDTIETASSPILIVGYAGYETSACFTIHLHTEAGSNATLLEEKLTSTEGRSWELQIKC